MAGRRGDGQRFGRGAGGMLSDSGEARGMARASWRGAGEGSVSGPALGDGPRFGAWRGWMAGVPERGAGAMAGDSGEASGDSERFGAQRGGMANVSERGARGWRARQGEARVDGQCLGARLGGMASVSGGARIRPPAPHDGAKTKGEGAAFGGEHSRPAMPSPHVVTRRLCGETPATARRKGGRRTPRTGASGGRGSGPHARRRVRSGSWGGEWDAALRAAEERMDPQELTVH